METPILVHGIPCLLCWRRQGTVGSLVSRGRPVGSRPARRVDEWRRLSWCTASRACCAGGARAPWALVSREDDPWAPVQHVVYGNPCLPCWRHQGDGGLTSPSWTTRGLPSSTSRRRMETPILVHGIPCLLCWRRQGTVGSCLFLQPWPHGLLCERNRLNLGGLGPMCTRIGSSRWSERRGGGACVGHPRGRGSALRAQSAQAWQARCRRAPG